MKTFFTNLPKIIATIFGLIVALFIIVAMVNSLFLFKFENQFEAGENIKGTECRDTISACGDLTGTDDFTYMAAALIEVKEGTKGVDEKALKAYYEGAGFGLEGAADASHTVKVEVFELGNNTGMFSPSICPDRTYMFNNVTTVRNFENCYVVIIYDMGNNAPLDYRTYFA